MTNSELSNEFDVLYNNITSNRAPELSSYEKSVFLTMGQMDILRAYFNARKNKVQQGFDESKERQIDFSTLMETTTLQQYSALQDAVFDTRSVVYRIPDDLLLFINETCQDDNYRYTVVPISYQEYDMLMQKPYQYPTKRSIWRLMTGATQLRAIEGEEVKPPIPHVELIGRFDKDSLVYKVRYIRKPRPIILEDLEDGLTIQGKDRKSTCELDESLHPDVLQRAIELAKASFVGDFQTELILGQASKTEIGAVAQSK